MFYVGQISGPASLSARRNFPLLIGEPPGSDEYDNTSSENLSDFHRSEAKLR